MSNEIALLTNKSLAEISSIEAKRIVNTLKTYPEKLDRSLIIKLQHLMESLPEKIENTNPFEMLSDGIYFREITVPANTIAIGATHKSEHLFMVIRGRAKIITNDENIIVNAGYITKAKPFTKRIAITFQETVFVNVHSNKDNITDLYQLRKLLVDEDKEKNLWLTL